jgi:hypothetical protein
MNDVELAALAAMVTVETAGLEAENKHREHCGHSIAYGSDSFTELDCVRCLDA